ncbi:MAG: arsenite methyltransferase [Haloferacaceae archaeon]
MSEEASGVSPEEQRDAVREQYAAVAAGEADSCCGTEGAASGCCASDEREVEALSGTVGYSADEMEAVPAGANLGLGCGNPTAIASLESGETVLDLGSGAGFDCFLAAREVAPDGRVVGVDMTPEMVTKARENAASWDHDLVEFRLGEIEHLPVADESVDVVISNCVVNLSPDKPQVFREAHRVLRPGGRLAISDVVRTADLPAAMRGDLDAIAGCVGGAERIETLEATVSAAGFEDVRVEPKGDQSFLDEWTADADLAELLASATIEGRKPE